MNNLGYLYFIHNEWYRYLNKIGSTINPVNRFFNYKTYYPTRCNYTLVIRIINSRYNCYQLDDMLKRDTVHKDYPFRRIKQGGGIEFYDVNNKSNIFKWLDQYNVKYEIVTDVINQQIDKVKNIYVLDRKQIFDEDIIQDNINRIKYRHGQKQAHDSFMNILNFNTYWGLLIAPTGWGKSFMHQLFIASYWSKFNKSIMLITKRKDILIDQLDELKQRLQQFQFIYGFGKYEIIEQINNFNIKLLNKNRTKLVIINSDKLITRQNKSKYKLIDWKSYGLVLFDEVHWSGAKRIHEFMNHLKLSVDYCIGSSATPVRSDLQNQKNIKSLFGKDYNTLYELSYKEAWDHKVIVPIEHVYFNVTNYRKETNEKNNKTTFVFKAPGKHMIIKKISSYYDISHSKKMIFYTESRLSLLKWIKFIIDKGYFSECSRHVSFSSGGNDKVDKLISELNISNANLNDGIVNFKKCNSKAILFVVFRACEGFNDPLVDIICNLDFCINRSIGPIIQKMGRAQRIRDGKKCGYFLSPVPDLNKDNYLNYICNILMDYIKCVSVDSSNRNVGSSLSEMIKKYFRLEVDDVKTISYNDIIKRINKLYAITRKEIREIVKCENERRKKYGLKLIETKYDYYKFASVNERLPIDPEQMFKNCWKYILSMDGDYYTYDEAKKVLSEYRDMIGEMSIDEIYEMARSNDSRLVAEPSEYYSGFSNMSEFMGVRLRK